MWPFKEPTEKQKLERELKELEALRIYATARVAAWRADERFKRAEITRVQQELFWLTEAAADDAGEALVVEAAERASAVDAVRRIH